MTTPNLEGVDVKIERAKRHLADLKRELEAALDPDRYRIIPERDEEAANKLRYRVHGLPVIQPEWRAIVGDFLFNLRSALDHLAWQLVILDGREPTEETQFPILKNPPRRKKNGRRKRVQLIPPVSRRDILDALERAQPYSRMDGVDLDATQMPLWHIRVLNNIDKHRLLLVVACALSMKMSWGLSDGIESPGVEVNLASLHDHFPVAWFDFGGSEPPSDFNPHIAIQVELREPSTPRLWHTSVLNVLGTLLWCVEDWLLNHTFRPLFTGVPPNPFA